MESVKAVSDVLSPVSGVVKAVNEELLDNPALVNEDPYGAWLIQVEQMTDEEERCWTRRPTRPTVPRRRADMAGYLPAAAAERAAQYAALGLSGPEALYRDVPESVRLTAPLNLPPPQSELEVRRTLEALAEQNLRFRTILRGAGAYDHYIPAAVSRIASKEEFVTAYTPYQAEISQGVLQSIFEFQTMICELTGLDAANASVYDGASPRRRRWPCAERKRRGPGVRRRPPGRDFHYPDLQLRRGYRGGGGPGGKRRHRSHRTAG